MPSSETTSLLRAVARGEPAAPAWFPTLKAIVLLLSALVLLGQLASLVVSLVLWWLGFEDQARRLMQPAMYLLEHPPTAALASWSAGMFAMIIFFRQIASVMGRLKSGFGFETHSMEIENKHRGRLRLKKQGR